MPPDTLNKGERSLVADGRAQFVIDMRKAYQNTMRHDPVARRRIDQPVQVIAFLNDNHIAIETLVLEPRAASAARVVTA